MITIGILEKPSARQLLVSWRETGRCNYTEQLWILGKAPKAATCALTDKSIRRGDPVYRPAGHPLNCDKVILADSFHELLGFELMVLQGNTQ